LENAIRWPILLYLIKKEFFMNEHFKPLLNDEYTGDAPSKRLLAYLQSKRNKGKRIIGVYCSYAPVELIRAFGLIPATLCAFSSATIDAAETVLPTNLCPLIKSSYGFIIKDSCPFFGLSEAVVGETTCDGKKKMFELISGISLCMLWICLKCPMNRRPLKVGVQ